MEHDQVTQRFRYLRYLKYKAAYDSLPKFTLDFLSKLGVTIQPFYFFQEGLHAGMQEKFAGQFSNFHFRCLEEKDMTNIAALTERNIPLSLLLSQLEKGRRCFGCLDGDELAAFSWFDLEYCHFPGHFFKLKNDEAYLFDAHTLQKYRGQGLAPYVRYRLCLDLKRLGKTKLYSFSERYNKPAIRFKLKLNAELKERGIYLSVFNRWHYTIHQQSRRINLEEL